MPVLVISPSTSPTPQESVAFNSSVRGDGGLITCYEGFKKVTSNNTTIQLFIERRGGNAGQITIPWQLDDGSVTAGASGYTDASGSVVFSDGETGRKAVNVTINNCATAGSDYFYFVLGTATISAGTFKQQWPTRTLITVDTGTIDTSAYVAATTGSDSNTGTGVANARATPQEAIDDCIAAGADRVYVRAGTYVETDRKGGTDYGGTTIEITSARSLTTMLRIEPYPGDAQYVLEGNNQLDSEGHRISGYYLFGADTDYLIIDGVEITDVTGSGIMDGQNAVELNEYIYFNNIYAHDYEGSDNIGMCRMDFTRRFVVSNSRAHNITHSVNAGVRWAGVHGYKVEQGCYENNTFYNMGKGIFIKHPSPSSIDACVIRRNKFYEMNSACVELAGNSTVPGIQNAWVYDNIGYDANVFYDTTTAEATAVGNNIRIFSNTAENISVFSTFKETLGCQMHDNIVYGNNLGYTDKFVISGESSVNAYSLTSIDYNLYYSTSNVFILNRNNGTQSFDETDWQTAYTVGSGVGLSEDPDANSTFNVDPGFTDLANNDYTLTSSKTGRYGTDKGAHGYGSLIGKQ